MNKNIFVDENTIFNPEKGEFELLPEIVQFTIDKNILIDETPAIVNWIVSNATTVKLNNETVELIGSKGFHTDALLSIVLCASNDAGEAPTQTLILDIDRQPPVIKSFEIDVPFAINGSPITLSWDIEGAKKIEIDNGIGDVSNLNSKVITLNRNGVFNLTAKNYFGIKAERNSTVSVFPTPLIEGVFIPEPKFNLPMITFNQPKFNVGEISLNQPLFNFQTQNTNNTKTNNPDFTKIDKLADKILFEKKAPNSIFQLRRLFKLLLGKKK